jgi:hypothetical protein
MATFWRTFMMVYSAQAGEVEDARPPPFTLFTITSKVVVYAPAERAETLLLFLLPFSLLCLSLPPALYRILAFLHRAVAFHLHRTSAFPLQCTVLHFYLNCIPAFFLYNTSAFSTCIVLFMPLHCTPAFHLHFTVLQLSCTRTVAFHLFSTPAFHLHRTNRPPSL